MDVLEAISVALVVAVILYVLCGFRLSSRVPGPLWVAPLIGENIEFISSSSPAAFYFKKYKKYNHGHNPAKLIRSYLFGAELVLVGSYEHWKSLNAMEPEKIKWGLPFEAINQLVNLKSSSEPDLHQWFRKHMTASLSLTNLRSTFIPRLPPIFERHVSKWFDNDGSIHEMDGLVREAVMEVALRVVAGFNDLSSSHVKMVGDVALRVQDGIFAPPINLPGFTFRKSLTLRPTFLSLLEALLRARFEVDPANGALLYPSNTSANNDTTLATLLEFKDRNELPLPSLVADRIVSNVVAASDTTSGALLVTMVGLSLVPGLIEKLRREQARVISEHGDAITWDLLQQSMPLLDAAVKEASRILPFAIFVGRKVKDEGFELGGIPLKKGTQLIALFSVLHALADEAGDPSWESDGSNQSIPTHIDLNDLPKSFKVERWASDKEQKPTVATFGHGKHMCLGMSLAMSEIKVCVCLMLRKGTWECLNEDTSFVYLPKSGLKHGPAKIKFTKSSLPNL